jgi:hypothetical protein
MFYFCAMTLERLGSQARLVARSRSPSVQDLEGALSTGRPPVYGASNPPKAGEPSTGKVTAGATVSLDG